MTEMLNDGHREILEVGSGISPEIIAGRGYRTVTTAKELKPLGFTKTQWNVPGLLLPVHTPDGKNGELYSYRPDKPNLDRNGKVRKYLFPYRAQMRLDCPPTCQPQLANPQVGLWITEGQKKADALATRGLCAIALMGVWNFKGKNDFGGTTILADLDHIAWDSRQVNLVFDSDVMTKPQVRKALDRLTAHLQRKKAHVRVVYLPSKDGAKVGVDDYLLNHTVEDLRGLVEQPRPETRAAAPVIELLEDAPKIMRRPLSLIDGVSYAAIWPWTKTTTTESVNKKGEIVIHDPPIETKEQKLIIIRGDGTRFAQEAAQGILDIESVGISANLPEIPRLDRLWSTGGALRYLHGERSDKMDIFNRVVDVVDRFIDFDKSLADQRTMSEMVALYVMGTYFLPAMTVVGYLWPNGERGSGKTQLLFTICEMAYLGNVILSGSTHATLRDLADYGSCLAFDDAENIMDKRRGDPDKQSLLLAGNRRGATVAVKEQVGNREWRTRQVDTFCPRLFSAIRLPDVVLGSRTIVLPLLRTLDRFKANADPLDETLWPHDRRRLVDDLWALALAHLPELSDVDRQVSDVASLKGRALDAWRIILTIALWLDEEVFKKMNELSVSYQEEKRELETTDLSALAIMAMLELAEEGGLSCDDSDNSDNSVNKRVTGDYLSLSFTVRELGKVITRLAKEMDRHSGEEPFATPQRIGHTLSRLRLAKGRVSGGGRERSIMMYELRRLAVSYGITPSLLTPLTLLTQNDDEPTETVQTQPKIRRVDLMDLAFGDDKIDDNEIVIDGDRVRF